MNNLSNPKFLVSTAWLAEHIQDPNLLVFDCGELFRSKLNFIHGHIPTAQFIDVHADASDPLQQFHFMAPTAETFESAMQRLGVNKQSQVVLYSNSNIWWATRVWCLFYMFGFDNVAILNGGWEKWLREERSVETGVARTCQLGNFKASRRRDLMIDKEIVRLAIDNPEICIVNALARQKYIGDISNNYGRPGRIKGSVNLPATELLDPETHEFLAANDLRKLFANLGAMEKQIITYCGGGISASALVFVLLMLGHGSVKLYDASLSEWALDLNLPMEIG